jgi:hypothetical protein
MEAFLYNLRHHHIFGRYMGHCYQMDYQKRGLPHPHLLLILHEIDHFLDPASIDKIICTEFLSRTADPELHNIITSVMVQGPCGDENQNCPCMIKQVGENVKCSKGFPGGVMK